MLADHVADARDDGVAVGASEKIDFHFDALANAITPLGVKQHAGDAQIDRPRALPAIFIYPAHTRRPTDAIPMSSPRI